MPAIYHNFKIAGKLGKVFKAISRPKEIQHWWPIHSKGKAGYGETYLFDFGPEYNWKGRVTKFIKNQSIEWVITEADEDWTDTTLSFELEKQGDVIHVSFCHEGWRAINDHFKISNYCWAQYLRTLKRYVELGEIVSYEDRGGS